MLLNVTDRFSRDSAGKFITFNNFTVKKDNKVKISKVGMSSNLNANKTKIEKVKLALIDSCKIIR
jgi:hypothetical protein